MREVGGCVGRVIAAKQVQCRGEPFVDVLLNDVQGDPATRTNVLRWGLFHELCCPSNHALQTCVSHKHMVGLFSDHELCGSSQRVERAFSQSVELILAVSVHEHRETEEGQPVQNGFVKGFQNPG